MGALKSSLSSVVNNVLGCLMMDQKRYEEAEKALTDFRDQRNPEDKGGLRTAYSNLSKLYFRWAQDIGGKDPEGPRIREYLEKAQKEMALWETVSSANGVTVYRRDESKEVTLKIAMDRLEGRTGVNAPDWLEELGTLKKNVAALEAMHSKDTLPDILAARNNIAVIYALQENYGKAVELLSLCMEQKKDVPILEFHCQRNEFDKPEFFEDCWYTGRRDLPELKDFTFRQHPKIHVE